MIRKTLLMLAVLVISAAFTFSQDTENKREMTEEEVEAAIKNSYDERDKLLSKPQVIYYSPVINPAADYIAYVKRTVEYRLKGGGLFPFLSAPPEVTWISDKIELCERELATGREKVISAWELPKPDTPEVGTVFVNLDWRDRLYYRIHLSNYERTSFPEGHFCSGGGICLSNEQLFKDGSNRAKGISVSVDLDSERHRYPTSNKVIITCDNPEITCPKL